mmetsp:Transcript_2794/g.5803  ORF Transcript_2794/g.5803 Transcript_2794/m.5803 type:complete len:229 (-) Transcript_2794:10-696(-)
MPSEPTRRSPSTVSPVESCTRTRSPTVSQLMTSAPLVTVCPTRSSNISCRMGRSMTTDDTCPRLRAGESRSNVANHSSDSPSLRPFIRLPITVASSRMRSYTPWSIRRIDSAALEAIWMGPPNGRNLEVFSYTWTLYPIFKSTRAVHSPPIPPPAMITSSVVSSPLRPSLLLACAGISITAATGDPTRLRWHRGWGEAHLSGARVTPTSVDALTRKAASMARQGGGGV